MFVMSHIPVILSPDTLSSVPPSDSPCRSRPVIGVSVSMTFNPQKISLSSYDCSVTGRKEAATTVTLCFTHVMKSTQAKGKCYCYRWGLKGGNMMQILEHPLGVICRSDSLVSTLEHLWHENNYRIFKKYTVFLLIVFSKHCLLYKLSLR